MKPFKFTLQPLRTVRQRREQEAMEQYARALLERGRAFEQLHAAERALSAAQSEWHQKAQRGCRAEEMSRYAQYCDALARVRDEKQNLLAQAGCVTQARLKGMLHARQQREAVDKFLDRQQLAYDRALTREEQKLLDELAQRREERGLVYGLHPLSAL